MQERCTDLPQGHTGTPLGTHHTPSITLSCDVTQLYPVCSLWTAHVCSTQRRASLALDVAATGVTSCSVCFNGMQGVRPAGLQKVPTVELAEFIEVCIGPREGRPRARQLLKHPYFDTIRQEKCAQYKLQADGGLMSTGSGIPFSGAYHG